MFMVRISMNFLVILFLVKIKKKKKTHNMAHSLKVKLTLIVDFSFRGHMIIMTIKKIVLKQSTKLSFVIETLSYASSKTRSSLSSGVT